MKEKILNFVKCLLDLSFLIFGTALFMLIIFAEYHVSTNAFITTLALIVKFTIGSFLLAVVLIGVSIGTVFGSYIIANHKVTGFIDYIRYK